MIDYDRIPESTRETIDAWVETARPVGHFVEAVLLNDLKGAFARADEWNTQAMRDIVAYVYSKIPAGCHGSREAMDYWRRVGGQRGLAEAQAGRSFDRAVKDRAEVIKRGGS